MTDDNFHNLALNESFERVAKVAKEREAFNEQMAAKATAHFLINPPERQAPR